jgi:hypothetical protein
MKLKSLRQALAPLTKFGQDEMDFEVDSGEGAVRVYLRPLLPREEIDCQRKARDILLQAKEESDGDDVSRAAAIEYFDRFRIEVISYALVQVGEQDFREVKFVETEETLPNGTPVRVPLHQALRDLISEEWSRGMITICWSKYGDLMTKIAQRAEKVAEQTLADLDSEILRLSDKLTKLKVEREDRAKGDPSVTMDQIRTITNLGQALEEEVEDAIQQAQADRDFRRTLEKEDEEEEFFETPSHPAPSPQAPPARKPVIPPVVPPPTAKPPQREQFPSSFGDPDDLDSLLLQEQEAARILEAQRRSREASSSPIGRDMSRAEPAGQVTAPSGQTLEAYRLPSETISSRGHKEAPKREAPVRGNHNPNFIPPRK